MNTEIVFMNAGLLTDLSEAFDWLLHHAVSCDPHDLLIEKLHAYGIKKGSLNLLFFYSKNRKQWIRLNNTYSEWIDILLGNSEGSILDLLLFIFMRSVFVLLWHPCTKLLNTKYPVLYWFKNVNCSNELENATEALLKWFNDNRMKANSEKYHLLINNTKEIFK